jgi:hypothetical protein
LKKISQKLAAAPLYRFADWPAQDIPRVAAGVYAIYDASEIFLYVGMAGAGLDAPAIEKKKATGKQSGIFDRLASHATGYRSGDRFNIYIGDLFVLPELSEQEIAAIADRTISFDSFIKDFIRSNLSFRYIELPYSEVREFERYVQRMGLNGVKPTINPIG